MKKFLKENWFKLVITLVIILIGISIFYYFVILSYKKEIRIQKENERELLIKKQTENKNNTLDNQKKEDNYISSLQEKKEPSILNPKIDIKTINSNTFNWITYISKDDNFSILLPGTPEVKIFKIPDDIKQIKSNNYYSSISKSPSLFFSIKSQLFNDSSLIENIDYFLELDLKESLLDGEKIISSNYIYFNNHRVLKFNTSFSDNIRYKGMVVWADGIYNIKMGYVEENYSEEIYNKFINSFKILK